MLVSNSTLYKLIRKQEVLVEKSANSGDFTRAPSMRPFGRTRSTFGKMTRTMMMEFEKC